MKYIEDKNEWNDLMETSKHKLVVVDFTASWYVLIDSSDFFVPIRLVS